MGKTYTHPQPDWFPLHELPFRVPQPRTKLAEDDPCFDPFEVPSFSDSEAAAARADGIAAQFDLKNGFRFAGVNREQRAFLFQQKSASDRDYDDADRLSITIPILTNRNPIANALFRSFGDGSKGYAFAAIGDAIDRLLEIYASDFELWARPQSPRGNFAQIDRALIKFYRTSNILNGVLSCDGTEALFDAHLVSTRPPETALASEEQAIEFAANVLRNNPNMSKDDLRTALGTKYLAHIADRRMNSWIWPEARARAGLNKRAKAGRKPGKSSR
jgi:hypothetical protein